MYDISQPELNEALFRWSQRALTAGRSRAAIDVAVAAMSAQPSVDAMFTVAQLMAAADLPAEAFNVLRAAARRYPEHATGLRLHNGLIYAGIGEYQQSVELLRTVAAELPSNRYCGYLLASALAHCRRFEEANAIFARGIVVRCGDHARTSSAVVRFPDPEQPLGRTLPFKRTLEFLRQDTHELADGDAEVVYFVACDTRYLALFAEPLATSLAVNGVVRHILHIHVVNPLPSTEAMIASLARHSNQAIQWSAEHVELGCLNEQQKSTYYACARFFVLPDLVRHYRLPIISADIDQFVMGRLDGLLADLDGHDVGLLRFPRQAANILSLISASVLLLGATSGAARFVDLVQDVLSERMAHPEAIGWHLDQAALAVGYLVLDELRYLLLRPTIMDSTVAAGHVDPPSRDALFWSVTFSSPSNIAKLRSPWFRQFLLQSGHPTARGQWHSRTIPSLAGERRVNPSDPVNAGETISSDQAHPQKAHPLKNAVSQGGL